jgi:hypothetical protein
MHNGQTHQNQIMMRQRLGVKILFVLCHIHHPLQEVVGLHVARIIRGLGSAALVDHGDEEVFGELELFFHLADGGEEWCYEGSEEVGEWSEEEDCYAYVDGVVACYVEPLFVAAEGVGEDSGGRAGY